MVKTTALAAHYENILRDVDLPGLPEHYRGKVRDNYNLPDGRRVIIASDRLSAFDRILTAIPLKGEVLTQLARYWFDATGDICPNHVIDYPDPNVLICRKVEILPVEMVVRDYMAGTTGTSIWTLYKQGRREMYGHRFPERMREFQKLPQTIITPTTKAFDAGHDEPLSAQEILDQGLTSPAQWEEVSARALALFARGSEMARKRGLILADTKYEFGLAPDGRILLADEIHTPDSSRYWFLETFDKRVAAGEKPESFDKDFVRTWVTARCDPYKDPIPDIPKDIVLEAARIYIEAFERITGQPFPVPEHPAPILDRIKDNLSRSLGLSLK